MPVTLTKATACKAVPPVRGQTMLWDTDVKGFVLRITPGGAILYLRLPFRRTVAADHRRCWSTRKSSPLRITLTRDRARK